MIDTRTPQQIANDEQADIPTQRYREAYAHTKAYIQESRLTTETLHAIATDEDVDNHDPAYRGTIAAYIDEYARRTRQPNDPGTTIGRYQP